MPGDFLLVLYKRIYWWQKCTLFECHCILHESATIEETIFISFSDRTAFFVFIQAPWRSSHLQGKGSAFISHATVECQYDEVPRDWQNLFAVIRFHVKEVLFDRFYYYWDKQNRFFYWGLCYIEVHYTEAPLYFNMLCFSPGLRNMWPMALQSCALPNELVLSRFSLLSFQKTFIMYTYSLSNTKQSTPPLPAMQLAVRKSSLPNKTNKIVVKSKMTKC